jgi:hypothetical protein
MGVFVGGLKLGGLDFSLIFFWVGGGVVGRKVFGWFWKTIPPTFCP